MSEEHHRKTDRLARALGWGSLGLGVIQLTAPNAVARLSGVDDSPWARITVPLVGVRELSHAAVLLGSRRPAPWAWTRVAGDALDLTVLGCSVANRTGWRRRRAAAVTAAVVGITAVDLYTAVCGSRRTGRRVTLRAAITVNRPREDVYWYWHDLENLPRFMAHLESVRATGDGRSHWKVKGPAGRSVEWDAVIIDDRPGELIAWHSVEGSAVGNSGSVRFTDAPGGRGTEVWVDLNYDPPVGMAGVAFAKLFGEDPEQQVRDDLRRFKQVMETGEVVRSEGSPEGIRAIRQVMQRPAQPVM